MSTRRRPQSEADFAALAELLTNAPRWDETIRRLAYWPPAHDPSRAVAMVEAVADHAWAPEQRVLTRALLEQLSRGVLGPHLRLVRVLDMNVPNLDVLERLEVLRRLLVEVGVRELHTFRARVLNGEAAIGLLGHYTTGLRILTISQSAVTSTGARAIASSQAFANLEELSLHSNSIDDDGAAALVGAPQLAGLRLLNLYDNRLSDDMVARLESHAPWQKAKLILHGQSG